MMKADGTLNCDLQEKSLNGYKLGEVEEVESFHDVNVVESNKEAQRQSMRLKRWKVENNDFKYRLRKDAEGALFPQSLQTPSVFSEVNSVESQTSAEGENPAIYMTFPPENSCYSEKDLMEEFVKCEVHNVDCYDDFPPYLRNKQNNLHQNQKYYFHHSLLKPFVCFEKMKAKMENQDQSLPTSMMDLYVN